MAVDRDDEIAVARSMGPHLVEPLIEPDEVGAYRRALLKLVNIGALRPGTLSDFSVAPCRASDELDCFAQIRSVPTTGFVECEFRFDIPPLAMQHTGAGTAATYLLRTADWFVGIEDLEAHVATVRATVRDALAPASSAPPQARLVAVGVAPLGPQGPLSTTVDLECLGDDLKMGVDRIIADDLVALSKAVAQIADRHVRRQPLLALARRSRATGWISEAALRIVDVSGFQRREILGMLRTRSSVEFTFGGDEGYDQYASLYWKDGVLLGDTSPSNSLWTLEANTLTILRHGLPQTMIGALPGRPLATVVELPIFPTDVLITGAETGGDGAMVLDLAIGTQPLDDASGEPRAPRADETVAADHHEPPK